VAVAAAPELTTGALDCRILKMSLKTRSGCRLLGGKADLGKQRLLLTLLIMFPVEAYSQDAPPALRGKSVSVTWAENRDQRRAGELAFRQVMVPQSLTIYVGTNGRPFSRRASGQGFRFGPIDSVGTSGATFGGGARQIWFANRSLNMIGTSKGGVARRWTIRFNESYSACDAEVVFAKQAGAAVVVGRQMSNGQPVEIRSGSITGTSCSLRDGNVFAE